MVIQEWYSRSSISLYTHYPYTFFKPIISVKAKNE